MSAASTDPPGLQGLVAGRYLVLWELPAAACVEVVMAEDITLHRLVEVRLLSATAAGDPLRAARFRAAARAAASLPRCEGLLPIYDQGDHDGRPLMVGPRRQGTTLQRLLSGGQRLPPLQTARAGADTAGALAVVHEAGVVHGNISGDTVLLGSDGQAVLTDLGLGDGRDQAGDVTDLARALVALLDDDAAGQDAAGELRAAGQGAARELRALLEAVAFGRRSDAGPQAGELAGFFRRLAGELGRGPCDPGPPTTPIPPLAAAPPDVDATAEIAVKGGGSGGDTRFRHGRRQLLGAAVLGVLAAAGAAGAAGTLAGHSGGRRANQTARSLVSRSADSGRTSSASPTTTSPTTTSPPGVTGRAGAAAGPGGVGNASATGGVALGGAGSRRRARGAGPAAGPGGGPAAGPRGGGPGGRGPGP
jgi:tRNA A-37 threonylcarbamoyl transferase component Bud32